MQRVGQAAAPEDSEPAAYWTERGFVPLFNGRDLTGWRNPFEWGKAEVVGSEIHLTGDKKFFLVTDKAYGDFRLSVDIHLPEGEANSGVMFRCHVEPNKVYGYQAECDGSDRKWSGGLYDEGRRQWMWPSTAGRSEARFLAHEAESQAFFKRPEISGALARNGWNRYVIECRGDHITIELNGVKVTDFHDDMDRSGPVGIQHHGEKGQTYRFRNLYIKELPDRPAEGTVGLFEQAPVGISRVGGDVFLVDFGRVAFGNILVTPPAGGGGELTFHFGEKLSGGRVDRKPPGTVRYAAVKARLEGRERVLVAPAADGRNTEQVSANHPPAVLTPEGWGVVLPFRWVEVEGWPGEPSAGEVVRQAAFLKAWDDEAARFECSSELLNGIWELCRYSIKATTFAGVYVDGDRERIPYEADAYLNQLSHYAVDRDVAMARRTFDWLMEYPTWPSEWAPHLVFMAHADWMQTGDVEWLKPRYEALRTKTLIERAGPDGLILSDEKQRGRNDIVDWPVKERDGYVFTEVNTVVNAFHLSALRRLSELARAVGREGDAAELASRYERALGVFNDRLLSKETGIYRDGVGTEHSSLHANLFPLAFGLVPEERLPGVLKWVEGRGMDCSVYAAQYYMEGLFESGKEARALALMTAEGDRSWRHMVGSGTTITWEAWDQKYKPNQDWNHAWGAAPANLLPRYVLGVRPDEPGWAVARLSPRTGGLRFARGEVPTPRGSIEVDWEQGETFRLTARMPAGVTARVDLPATAGSTGVYAGAEKVAATRVNERWVVREPMGGEVRLEVR